MGNKKFKNLLLILILILIVIGIPYLLYTLGTFIEINYFGYLNNWWVVLLFVLVLISIFILGGIDLEKNMSNFLLLFFTIPFFILGIRFGVKPTIDLESYALLLDKEQEINRLDSILSKLVDDLAQLKDKNLKEQVPQDPAVKNHEIIFFASGSSKLSNFNELRIREFVSTLENCKLHIKGYTDGLGTNEFNKNISNKRAQNVASFIKSINLGNNTITMVTGFGDDYKLVENRNEVSRSKNRRVTIEVVEKIDAEAEALRKNIWNEIHKSRENIKNVKVERDSLRRIIYQNVEG